MIKLNCVRFISPILLAALVASLVSGCSSATIPQPTDLSVDLTSEVELINSSLARNIKVACPTTYLPPLASYPTITPVERAELEPFVRFYLGDGRKHMHDVFKEGANHLPVIEGIFREFGLPLELVNVAFLESSFRANARSPRGAVGMWQFTKDTARRYGLKVTGKLDERKDIVKSTRAAAQHLIDLYQMFGDWSLVLVAYNAGPGTVLRAIKKTGSRDFFEIVERKNLNRESTEFVMNFHALTAVSSGVTLSDTPVMYASLRRSTPTVRVLSKN